MQPSGPDKPVQTDANSFHQNDLAREVYGVLGIPVDAIDMANALRRIETAAANATPFLISTANLHWLLASRSDKQFRESLLASDLCTADGMPIVWVARLLGLPIRARVAGSDIFEALKSTRDPVRRLKVFLFGGVKGAAAAACERLNAEPGGLVCVGWYDPGFCTVDEMSTDAILNAINSSDADFLAVALGAEKGQSWLLRNHDRLRVPIRAHLGATINFQAGTIKRAPQRLRKWGLEWLWRIKEEPQLWNRYWRDGIAFLRLVLMQAIPLIRQRNRFGWRHKAPDLLIKRADDHETVILSMSGAATAENVHIALPCFRDAAAAKKPVVINFANTCLIDARFLGLLLMLNKHLKKDRLRLELVEVSQQIGQIFRLSGFGYLLGNYE